MLKVFLRLFVLVTVVLSAQAERDTQEISDVSFIKRAFNFPFAKRIYNIIPFPCDPRPPGKIPLPHKTLVPYKPTPVFQAWLAQVRPTGKPNHIDSSPPPKPQTTKQNHIQTFKRPYPHTISKKTPIKTSQGHHLQNTRENNIKTSQQPIPHTTTQENHIKTSPRPYPQTTTRTTSRDNGYAPGASSVVNIPSRAYTSSSVVHVPSSVTKSSSIVNVSSRISTSPSIASAQTSVSTSSSIEKSPSSISTSASSSLSTKESTFTDVNGLKTSIIEAPAFGSLPIADPTYSWSNSGLSSFSFEETEGVSSTDFPVISCESSNTLLETSSALVGDLHDETSVNTPSATSSVMNPTSSSLASRMTISGNDNSAPTMSFQAGHPSSVSSVLESLASPRSMRHSVSSSNIYLPSSSIIVVPGDSSSESDLSALSIKDGTPTLGSLVCVGASSCSETPPVGFRTSDFSVAMETGPISDKSKGLSTGSKVPKSQDRSPLSSADSSPSASASSSVNVEFENAGSSSKAKFAVLLISIVALAI